MSLLSCSMTRQNYGLFPDFRPANDKIIAICDNDGNRHTENLPGYYIPTNFTFTIRNGTNLKTYRNMKRNFLRLYGVLGLGLLCG